ncbi:MAG: sigma-70 family RNA polymerase sigma factor [Ilumatobacteraceae bacterium]
MIGSDGRDAAVHGFEDLYLRELGALVRLGVLLVGDRRRAEELVHEAFVDVWQRWDDLDRPGVYLRRCVVHRCYRELRRRRWLHQREPTLADLAVDDQPRLLLDVISHLPARRRAIVALRFDADMDEQTIADTLGIRPGTVRAGLHQALQQLRKVIEP